MYRQLSSMSEFWRARSCGQSEPCQRSLDSSVSVFELMSRRFLLIVDSSYLLDRNRVCQGEGVETANFVAATTDDASNHEKLCVYALAPRTPLVSESCHSRQGSTCTIRSVCAAFQSVQKGRLAIRKPVGTPFAHQLDPPHGRTSKTATSSHHTLIYRYRDRAPTDFFHNFTPFQSIQFNSIRFRPTTHPRLVLTASHSPIRSLCLRLEYHPPPSTYVPPPDLSTGIFLLSALSLPPSLACLPTASPSARSLLVPN